jgi:hypothetical protein
MVSQCLQQRHRSTHLKDENELGLGVDDIVKADNVDVLELCTVSYVPQCATSTPRQYGNRC